MSRRIPLGMDKKTIDRHVDEVTVSFTLLVQESRMEAIKRVAKSENRTKGYVVREAIEQYLRRRSRRTK
jgi:predicted transcriptional regulator